MLFSSTPQIDPRLMPSSPASSASSRSSTESYTFPRVSSDFQVEHLPANGHTSPSKARRRRASSGHDGEAAYRASVARLMSAKIRPFAVTGRIPIDPSHLTLFFRSKGGITHCLDFPIDIDHDMPPSLDVLISACRPHSPSGLEDFSDHESLFYPTNLPLTTTLEIANHPILDAVRNTLFPTLPKGHYLTTVRDKLEIWVKGSGMKPLARPNDSRVATILVTLPVRFRGGSLLVRSAEGMEERYHGRGGRSGDIEWTAFMADCDHEIEPVTKGCRLTVAYAVHLKTFGTAAAPGLPPDPLITPSDNFLDMLSPILNMSRGRKIAFHLSGEYGVNPAETLAESLVPNLTGGDSILYHALKLFKLSPELHWTAGGYVWSIDQMCDISSPSEDMTTPAKARTPFSVINGARLVSSPVRSTFSSPADEVDPMEEMRIKVEKSGAVPLSEAGIVVLSDTSLGPIGKERLPFAKGDDLERLLVSGLMAVYVP